MLNSEETIRFTNSPFLDYSSQRTSASRRNIAGSSKIRSCNTTDRPEAEAGPEDADIVNPASTVISRDRPISNGSEVASCNSADRPEAGTPPEDPGRPVAQAVVIAGDQTIAIRSEVEPSDPPQRPQPG